MSSLNERKSTTDVSQSDDMPADFDILPALNDGAFSRPNLAINSRRTLNDLISQMPNELPLVEGWDEMPSVGLEQ